MSWEKNMGFADFYVSENSIRNMVKKDVSEGRELMECVFRMGSDAWCDYFKEARNMKSEGYKFCDNDNFILETDMGKIGISLDKNELYEGKRRAKFQGKSVALDSPTRTPKGDNKKFQVYINSGKKDKDGKVVAKKIRWGDPNLKVKNYDKKASKSFRARHKCSTKSDRTTPGWWACNVGKYAKQLGLSSSNPW